MGSRSPKSRPWDLSPGPSHACLQLVSAWPGCRSGDPGAVLHVRPRGIADRGHALRCRRGEVMGWLGQPSAQGYPGELSARALQGTSPDLQRHSPPPPTHTHLYPQPGKQPAAWTCASLGSELSGEPMS